MRKKRILPIIIVLSTAITGLFSQDQDTKLYVKILQVPAFQSVTRSVPSTQAKEGEVPAVLGIRTGGDVTQDFPDGIFMFETEILQNEEELIRVINDKTSTIFPVAVNILPAADITYLIDRETFETTFFYEKIHPLPPLDEPLSLDYDLQVQAFPFSGKDEAAAVKIKFSAKYKANHGEKKLLLDQIIGVKSTRKLVVGFPSDNDHGRGTIYWLTFYMDKEKV